MELILCLQDGMKIEVQGDKVILKIDTDTTKRDLWKAQITYYLEKNFKLIESGNLRIENKDKLSLSKHK
jgi:predicted porin